MKRFLLAAVCTAACLLTCSCNQGQYFAVAYNRYSRVYAVPNTEVSDAAYSYDLYQNPALPLKQYSQGIYYYFRESYSTTYTSPYNLSVIDPYSGSVRTLCTNTSCYHNNLNYTTRCILCDIYDASKIVARGGYIYYARADKSYFNEYTGTTDYIFNNDLDEKDEVEFEYSLIEYDPQTCIYKVCYKVEPGGYIDNITAYGDYVYFYETAYELIKNLEFSHSDIRYDEELDNVSGAYYFIDSTTGKYELFDAALFYDRATQRDKPYRNIRQNRKMLLKENHPYKKVYKLQKLNPKTGAVITLATHDSLPKAFDIFDSRIYELRDSGYYSYDLDYHTEYESSAQPGPIMILNGFYAAGANSFQYDQFTKNIYYLKDGVLSKVKAAGESFHFVRTMDLCPGNIVWYQLSYEGVYFMLQGDSSVYLAKYTDINYANVPYEKVFEPDPELLLDDGYISAVTVIDDWLYYLHTKFQEFSKKIGENELIYVVSESTGPYRYSLVTGETQMIWPEGWKLYK
jgi:hypothetical protein